MNTIMQKIEPSGYGKGFSYGACLSLFPSAAADYWGTKNLGLNYGILFTAYGVAGVFGPILAGGIADLTGSYDMAYMISATLMILATVLTFFTKAPEKQFVPDSLIRIPAREMRSI